MYIDFRLRPPYDRYIEKMFQNTESRERFAKLFGYTCSPSMKNGDMGTLLEEMEQAGIDMAVVPGRGSFGTDNHELIRLAEEYPGKFVIFPFLDPMKEGNVEQEIEELLSHDCVKGFCIEPGVPPAGSQGYLFDDERAFPLYRKVQEAGVPLMVTFSGHTVSGMDSGHVTRMDRVAVAFPNLNLVLAHAGFPWIMECIGMAFRRKNVYLLPDGYGTNSPGASLFAEAANSLIPDQVVFGTAYPIIPVEETVDHYLHKAGYREDVLEKVMCKNAKKLLHME